MEFVMTILEGAWRYVTTIRIADYLDIALMAYCCYLLLRLVRSTRAESLVKGIMVFLLALWISHVFKAPSHAAHPVYWTAHPSGRDRDRAGKSVRCRFSGALRRKGVHSSDPYRSDSPPAVSR